MPSAVAVVTADGYNLTGVPALILGILGVLSLLAAAAAIIRSTYAKTQIEALRGDRDDLTARVDILEREKDRLTTELGAEVERRKALETVVTGRRELAELRDLLEAHHGLLEQHHDTAREAVRMMGVVDEKVSTLLRQVPR